MARRKLTTELIVAEAIDLLGEEGLDGLSMRKLATRLQVQAPTLYYHIPDKSALLNEVLARLFSMCFERIPPCATWQEWMLAFGGAIWDVQQEHPYAPLLILQTPMDEAHFGGTVNQVRQAIAVFDADQDTLFFVQSAVQAVVTGWSIFGNSAYAIKISRIVDCRAAALNSVQALVDSWEGKVGRDTPLRAKQ